MTIFTELVVIIVLATVVAGIMRALKQPLIIGYILTGLIAGPLVFNIIQSRASLEVFSELGIALLLFLVGLQLSPLVIKEIGRTALLTGLGQIIFTSFFGFLLARLFDLPLVTSLYLAVALTFSSTIIILKLLSDKRHLERLYGKISIGFLLVQDIVAVLILIIVSSFVNGQAAAIEVFTETALKGAFLIALLVLVGMAVLPKLSRFFARSQELLFLFSIAWGLGLAGLFGALGFSIEIGALVAGVALSTSTYSVAVAARLKPLRDFFIIIFFILLGAQLVVSSLGALLVPAIIFSLFILIGNPLIVMIIMGLLGYSKRVGFMAGLTVAQISEFSLILVLLGVRLGHLTQEILSLVTVVGLVTIAGSTYFILYADRIYQRLAPYLTIFERDDRRRDEAQSVAQQYQVILFGLNRIGYDFLKIFRKLRKKFLVVDFNPEVGERLARQGIDYRYGDADDSEFLSTLPLSPVQLVVSTIPEFETNIVLITKIRQRNKKAVIIVLNHDIEEALQLYQRGASYVVLPHFLGGQYAAKLVERFRFSSSSFGKEKSTHIRNLKQRWDLGHQHPVHEKLR